MADEKPSTKGQEQNTVKETHEYFFPDLGVVVEAADAEAAEKLARKKVGADEPKQDTKE